MVILAAVDRSDRASCVIRESESLASAFDEPIHVVHVLSKSEFMNLGQSKAENREVVDMDTIRGVAEDIAREAVAEGARDVDTRGLVGNPAKRIVDYAEEHDVRYIVVAGRKRSPTGKAIFGSVTQSVLLNAPCPVLATISK